MAKSSSARLININQAQNIITDRVAMDTFYNNEIDKIKSLIFKFDNLDVDAKEIFQDCYIKARNAVVNGNYNGTSSFAAYFYTICKNMLLDIFKNKKTSPAIESIDNLAEEIVDDYSDLIQIMLKLKKNISSKCRQIIDLRYGIGYGDSRSPRPIGTKYSEIANKLQISEDNARKRFSNCFRDFRVLVMGHSEFQLLQFNAERKYHKRQIKLIIEGNENIYPMRNERIQKLISVGHTVNLEIAKIWIKAEKFDD